MRVWRSTRGSIVALDPCGVGSIVDALYEVGISGQDTIVGISQSENQRPVALLATFPASISVRPSLSINRSSTSQLVLSWSTNHTGFTLQSSTHAGYANWTNCSSPSVLGGNFVITNPMSAGAQLFRLKK